MADDPIQRFTDRVTYGSYRLGALMARGLPNAAVAAAFVPSLGFGANLASAERRAVIERHLRRVDPSMGGLRLRRAVQAAFDTYTKYWIESFRLPNLSARTVDRNMTEDGYHHIVTALDQGCGAIMALPHLGGWEWAGRWLADRGHPVTVVVERIDPPELFEWFRALRSDLGMYVVPLGPDAGRQVIAALRRNHIVCLLSDRDIQRNGVQVEFFGERTTLPAGPATLSLRTGAVLLPTAVYFTDLSDGHLGVVRPPIPTERTKGPFRLDVERITQQLARELEVLIRRAPTQWHLFQPNWPSDPGYEP